ncbi:MAG: serine O-acetyltransferase [Chloroflexota bacterium]
MNNQRKKLSESGIYGIVINLFYALQFLRAFLHIYLLLTSSVRSVIEKDIERWLEIVHPERYEKKRPAWMELVWLLWRLEEFRNLFYYRIKWEYRLSSRIILEFALLFYRPLPLLFVRADFIGEGLFIQHGYGTTVSAKRIGKNCWINQLVVIGFSDIGKYPTIGDNVHICTGAKVLGDVTVGDNSTIGANAVVVKDVPPNCTVVGVPAYIIKRDGKRVKEEL